MNLSELRNKEYCIPENIPSSSSHKYLTIIEKDYSKYIAVIYYCGKYVMQQQFYKIIKKYNPHLKESSCETNGKKILKELEALGFIKTDHINRNKFIMLRQPSLALITGDYKKTPRINHMQDLKNNNFKVCVMKCDFLLEHGYIPSGNDLFIQLQSITNEFKNKVIETNNKYNYDLNLIRRINECESFNEVFNLLSDINFLIVDIGIIKDLWLGIGKLYSKLQLHKQTVCPTPFYLDISIQEDSQVIIKYIADIIIFDTYDMNYYSSKLEQLYSAFFKCENNNLHKAQENFINNKNLNLNFGCCLGYKLTLIGANKEILTKKKEFIDSNLHKSINSPLMYYTDVYPTSVNQYLLHSSQKNNKYFEYHDRTIENLIRKKILEIND